MQQDRDRLIDQLLVNLHRVNPALEAPAFGIDHTLVFINDIFFVYEHTRKINVWSFFIVLSPYFGPLITAFIISKYAWNWPGTLLTGLCSIAVVLFAEGTFFNRRQY